MALAALLLQLLLPFVLFAGSADAGERIMLCTGSGPKWITLAAMDVPGDSAGGEQHCHLCFLKPGGPGALVPTAPALILHAPASVDTTSRLADATVASDAAAPPPPARAPPIV